MKVCMVVNNPFINDSRVLREAKTLSKNGYKVTVYATKGKRLPNQERINQVIIKKLVSRYDLTFKFWKLFSELLPIKDMLIKEEANVYHSHDLDTLLITYLAAKANNAKLIYDSHEFWADKTVEGKLFKKYTYKFVQKSFLPKLEGFLIASAEEVITVNNSISSLLASKYDIKRPIVIRNVAE